jgi:hypothetical protein
VELSRDKCVSSAARSKRARRSDRTQETVKLTLDQSTDSPLKVAATDVHQLATRSLVHDRRMSRHGMPPSADGSLGRPSTRSPRMLCCISDEPPAMVCERTRRNA